MKTLPIRFFHAVVSGLVLGFLLSVSWLQVSQNLSANPAEESPAVEESGDSENPSPEDGSSGIPAPPNPDTDGDRLPDLWETEFHHDPDSAADAGADFDNDGLTALEEYELHSQTSATSGNPLGTWTVETLPRPEFLESGWVWPVDINNRGDILVNASFAENDIWREAAFLIDGNREWTEIQPSGESNGGYLWGNDLNDRGEVVGGRYSEDWMEYEPFIWDRTAGYRTFTFDGRKADALKINNFGDWIGYAEDPGGHGMVQAFVVDGVNQHAPGDWWPNLWYSDINDFGEAMGSAYNPQTGRNHTILAHGNWRFDTGFLGGLPEFDPDTRSWTWSAAMNAYGEFTGGAGGTRGSLWSYLGYLFDGEFNEIRFGSRSLDSISPESLNSSNTIVGYASDSSGHWGAFIHRDGIGLFLDELLPEIGNCYTAKINRDGSILTISANTGQLIAISPNQDLDGDGMSDDWEDYHGLDKATAADSTGDEDGDGTNNLGEFILRTNPNAAPIHDPDGDEIDIRPGIDTDGDGMPNVWEWENGLNYEDPSDAPLDFDRDGYTNLQEFRLNTNPRGAPCYRIREVGPFPGTSSVTLSQAVLGDGLVSSSSMGLMGDNVTESVFFNARPLIIANGGHRPASWSILRSEEAGSHSLVPSHGSQTVYPVAQAPGAAFLSQTYGNPNQFIYWPSLTSTPVSLSGAAGVNNVAYLSNARLSPSGTYLVATRSLASGSGIYQPILWKMPAAGNGTFVPIRLTAPAGATLSDWASLHVNDHGYVAATGSVSGQSRPILWKINADGTSVTSSILPPLPGGAWASVSGISNQVVPVICGTSTIARGQQRATVWNPQGIATNLDTLSGGNYSTANLISRGGRVAGCGNVLVGNTLKFQVFLASFDARTSSWNIQPQGEPGNTPTLQSVNDSGEILGRTTEYSPAYRQIPTLWRHGRAYPLDTAVPSASGYTLDSMTALNPQGTLLASTWKDGAQTTILLTPDSDTDGDGLPDAFENAHSFSAFVPNSPAADSDSDSLSDLEEYRNGTHPRNPDTDDDGMMDGWEISWGLLPLDPTDAALDPDSDHVTNLRESQIGTTPTGIYKVVPRVIDTDWSYPSITAADDSGRIIHTGQYQYNSEMDESGFQVETYQQEYHTLPLASSQDPAVSIPLPPLTSYNRFNGDWSEYSYQYDSPTYWPDAVSGRIHGVMQRSTWSYDGFNYSGGDEYYLIPDAADALDESSWIPWQIVEENLKQGESPHLEATDTLNPWPLSVSQSGTHRIHQSNQSGISYLLNERGQLIRKLPETTSWQHVNDKGHAVALTTRYVAAANGLPGYYTPEIQFTAGESANTVIPIPNEPGVSPDYSLQYFSADGKVLLSKYEHNNQMAYVTRYFLFDIVTASLEQLSQPGIGNEYIAHLSSSNGRLVGHGPKPFQITTDGTCIRLEALRIKNSPTDTPEPFGSLYPGTPYSNHITADGRITLTTYDAQSRTTILQTVPHNDMDADGMGDDWEADMIDRLITIGVLTSIPVGELGQPSIDAEADYDGDGILAANEFAAGTSDADNDDFNSSEIVSPFVWRHGLAFANGTKSGTFRREFIPSVIPDSPSPIIRYYMKETWNRLTEAITPYSYNKETINSVVTIDRSTRLPTIWPPDVHEEESPPGISWPDWWWPDAWTEESRQIDMYTTKTQRVNNSYFVFKRPPHLNSSNKGYDIYQENTTLSDEYTTGMLIEDTDNRFPAEIAKQQDMPWIYGYHVYASTYLQPDETTYSKSRCDYAVEPPFSPDAPVRTAWLEVDRPYHWGGYMFEDRDDPSGTFVKLRQHYYSASDSHRFRVPPEVAKYPRTASYALDPGMNRENFIVPLYCKLDLYHDPGRLISTPSGANQPMDWEDWSSGFLSWNVSHPYHGLAGEEFDVPIRLDAVKGGDKIRLASKIWGENGECSYVPVVLPIEDVRNYPNGFVLQTLATGEVSLRLSLFSKHGLRLISCSKETTSSVDLDVDSNNDGQITEEDDRIEADWDKPGKILIGNRTAEANERTIPLNHDGLARMNVQTEDLPAGETLSFDFPDNAVRVWRTSPGQAITAGDEIQADKSYAFAKNTELYIQFLGATTGLVRIGVASGDASDDVLVNLLPVEIVELAPKLRDLTTDEEIDGSEVPDLRENRTNPMVELNPVQDRIAHREIKIRIGNGNVVEGKTVTWTMAPLFTPPAGGDPIFRGDWANSQNHSDRFEASAVYGAHGFERVSQQQGRTEIDAQGFTAIRANLPPVGFNKARISIVIEDFDGAIELIDMEVPAIVVIDPGHGGNGNVEGSNANNATSPSGVLEKNMTLDYGRELRNSIEVHATTNNLQIRVRMTRDEDRNPTGQERANVARNVGADVFHSFHFNATNGTARGSESLVRDVGNVNEDEDRELGQRVLDGVLAAIRQYDANGANDRGVKDYAWSKKLQKNVPSEWAVLSDTSYSNVGGANPYHPIRGIISEVEFIDVQAVDVLLNTGPNATNVRRLVANEVRDAIIEDINHQP